MFQAIRKHLTPSTAIALVALVFALTGGAFAATGGGGSHATLTASVAKKKAKAPARGPAGPKGATGATGPAGLAGPAGAAGAKGENGGNGKEGPEGKEGKAGTNGKNGKSVLAEPAGANCKEGGTSFEVEGTGTKESVCNGQKGEKGEKGEEGSPWTDGGKLPSGATETGTWAYQVAPGTGVERYPISFPIQLSEPLNAASENSGHVQVVPALVQEGKVGPGEGELCEGKSGEELEHCQAPYELTPQDCPSTAAEPTAKPGYLCIYEDGNLEGLDTPIYGGVAYPQVDFEESTVAGVVLVLPESEAKAGESGRGTWAVTAE
jgi:hypothetical protein